MILLGKVYMTKQNNNKIRGESAESFFFLFDAYITSRDLFILVSLIKKGLGNWELFESIFYSFTVLSTVFLIYFQFFSISLLFNNTCTAFLLCQLKRPCIVLLLFFFSFLCWVSCRIDVPCPGFLCRVCAAVRRVKLTVKRWHQVAGGAFSDVK